MSVLGLLALSTVTRGMSVLGLRLPALSLLLVARTPRRRSIGPRRSLLSPSRSLLALSRATRGMSVLGLRLPALSLLPVTGTRRRRSIGPRRSLFSPSGMTNASTQERARLTRPRRVAVVASAVPSFRSPLSVTGGLSNSGSGRCA
ncbi:hypothetical protein BZA05DRAFT_399365 [Tricharina praecox]|uniref:uncharacterized protein n=1 Tax=Tricharina praecox TaxID=43433 RepID=UPI00222027F0|nr:uncharacterized protein BZA05DRAFT_399365 [Tricharina praecox]KAI5850982.1 hypothetical protein BZA05DRAFT_399365 [Tricharina praecox]